MHFSFFKELKTNAHQLTRLNGIKETLFFTYSEHTNSRVENCCVNNCNKFCIYTFYNFTSISEDVEKDKFHYSFSSTNRLLWNMMLWFSVLMLLCLGCSVHGHLYEPNVQTFRIQPSFICNGTFYNQPANVTVFNHFTGKLPRVYLLLKIMKTFSFFWSKDWSLRSQFQGRIFGHLQEFLQIKTLHARRPFMRNHKWCKFYLIYHGSNSDDLFRTRTAPMNPSTSLITISMLPFQKKISKVQLMNFLQTIMSKTVNNCIILCLIVFGFNNIYILYVTYK